MLPNQDIEIQRFKALLKEKGLKATNQRLSVHLAMLQLGHASADLVCEHIHSKEGKDKITVASVYNVLLQMAKEGIYQQRMSANSKMYFDVNSYKHIHIYDLENNQYKDIMDDELINMVENYISCKRLKDYKLERVDIQLICHPK